MNKLVLLQAVQWQSRHSFDTLKQRPNKANISEYPVITIKKYPNRRLYDTSKSQYINLEAIKELVMSHKEFEVVDSKTDEKLTKSILLQIITEQEGNDQQAVLTETVLKQLIRFYGSDMQGFMRQYLEQSMSVFLERQDAMQTAMSDFMGSAPPLKFFNQMVEQNLSMWKSFTQAESANPPAGTKDSSDKPDDPEV